MATKADFTQEEWSQIQRAPFMAGGVVVGASPRGPFGGGKEMFAGGEMVGGGKGPGAFHELSKNLVGEI